MACLVRGRLGIPHERCFHWSTYSGAGLDLFVTAGGRRYGFEIKRTEAPRLTRSMRSALASLRLHRLDVIHASDQAFQMAPRVRALPAASLTTELQALPG